LESSPNFELNSDSDEDGCHSAEPLANCELKRLETYPAGLFPSFELTQGPGTAGTWMVLESSFYFPLTGKRNNLGKSLCVLDLEAKDAALSREISKLSLLHPT